MSSPSPLRAQAIDSIPPRAHDPKQLWAALLGLAVLAAVYGPGPRKTLSVAEARKAALVDLVRAARSGKKPTPNQPGEPTFALTAPELCRAIGGSFGDAESELLVRTWNEAIPSYKAQDITGCNYALEPVAFELLDEDGAFGFYFGEKGMGPKWTIDPPQARTLPDLRSLMPALLAILVAVGFRMVIPGLIAGIIVGALVGADGGLGGMLSGLLCSPTPSRVNGTGGFWSSPLRSSPSSAWRSEAAGSPESSAG